MVCSVKKKIVVGLSGGVDSAVAAVLLKRQGWDVVGVQLVLPSYKKDDFAKRVCKKLKIPFYSVDCRKDFKEKVIRYFLRSLKSGRTPNPCVVCNKKIKFKSLFDFVRKRKILYVATGHYAKVEKNRKSGEYSLLSPADLKKDQTYGLCFLNKNWLKSLIFPLSDLKKEEVYKIAEVEGFDFLLDKPQSQDLCFVSKKNVRFFLEKNIGICEGFIRDDFGMVLKKHRGVHFYTVGQKKGIGLSERFFVKGLCAKKNEVIVTRNRSLLSKKEIFLEHYNLFTCLNPKKAVFCFAKVRYNQPLQKAVINILDKKRIKVVFDKPVDSVVRGQFCVFYNGKNCLGGGVIKDF